MMEVCGGQIKNRKINFKTLKKNKLFWVEGISLMIC